ncbi:hypothetical protein ABTE34_19890, partial [Acinetobacter baumannii]
MPPDQSDFDPVLFIKDGPSKPLLDPKQYPYMCNDRGVGSQSETPVGEIITLAPEAPALERGATYRDIAHWQRTVTPKD